MCRCERVTYLCLCSHKERHIERCKIYQLRKEGSCLAYCFANCHTHTRRHEVNRVCKECQQYFHNKYGKHHYKKFIEYFLEYKQRKGWAKTAIDPRTVPRDVLLKRQSAPAHTPGTQAKGQGSRGQPFQVHQPMSFLVPSSSSSRQVDRPPTPPMNNEEADDEYASFDDGYDDGYPAPTDHVNDKNTCTTPRVIHNSPARLINQGLSQRMIAQQQVAQVNKQPAHINPQPARGDLRTLHVNPRPTPIDQLPALVNRQGTPFPHNREHSPDNIPGEVSLALALPPEPRSSEVSNSSKPAPLYIPNKDKPLPTNPSFFVVGDDDDDDEDEYDYGKDKDHDQDNSSDDEEDAGGVRVFTSSPPPKYNSNDLPAGNVVPELAHLTQSLPPQGICQLQQPTPTTLKNKKPIIRNADSMSDTSVVKNLTKVARNLQIPNIEYMDYDGKWVPRVSE